jgi:hypothetical protein
VCASPAAAAATGAASDLSEPQSLVLGGVYVCITSAKRVMYPALIINVMTWISENVIIAASQPASGSGRPTHSIPSLLSDSDGAAAAVCQVTREKPTRPAAQLCG